MRTRLLMAVILAVVCALIISPTGLAKPPAQANGILLDPLKIDTGYISGTVLGEPGDKEVHVYRGIPYAAPPVGDLRWQPPQPAESWSGIRECTVFSMAAPQLHKEGGPIANIPISEDCLYLNVYTAAKTHSAKLPVMVWMHGGGYVEDWGNNPTYTRGLALAQHGVVLVTVNMRLGAIGLLGHPLLTAEQGGVSGNYMFLDMIASLQWVQRNIAEFGGDPGNVTIFGESGGGSKVSVLMASPLAKGLFHRAICQSGTSVGSLWPSLTLDTLEERGEQLFDRLGVDSLEGARALPWEDIIAASNAEPSIDWREAVDGWLLPDTPTNLFNSGDYNAVPLIVLANLGEITGPGLLVMPQVIPSYVTMLEANKNAGIKGYAMIFDQIPAGWRNQGCVSHHAGEMVYIFGNVDSANEWANNFGLAMFSGATSPEPGVTAVDYQVSDYMVSMWTQCAKTGDPSVKKLVSWPAWKAGSDQYLYVNQTLQVRSGFSLLP